MSGEDQTAAVHLMSLVNDVLDMSRIDSGRIILNEENFSLADLIHDISVIVRPQAAQKNQTLRIEIGRIEEGKPAGRSAPSAADSGEYHRQCGEIYTE